MLFDSHVHFGDWDGKVPVETLYRKMMGEMDENGVDRFNINVCGRCPSSLGALRLADALWFKRRQPGRVTVFGGLDWRGATDGGAAPLTPFRIQLDQLKRVGCDGLKLLHGKPDRRKELGHPLDGDLCEPIYAWLEENDWPCVWHVADPPEFWNEATTPLWARRNGWWYDATHPPKRQIDVEARRVFAAHPGIRFVLAHFFFISQDLQGALDLLDTFPNLVLDLTPGVEIFHNFRKTPEAARDFFVKYADRIVYGTDIGMGAHTTGPKRGWMVRHWLQSGETFDVPDDLYMLPDDRTELTGVALPDDVTSRILGENFAAILGSDSPRLLNDAALRDLCRDLLADAEGNGLDDEAARLLLAELA